MPHGDPWASYLAAPFAPTPAGLAPRMEVRELPVVPVVAVNHSPDTAFAPGIPLPGPPAVATVFIDYDSMRWWGGDAGVGAVWSQQAVFTDDVPPALPESLVQHIDVWQRFWGGYPSLDRNRPPAFGDQVAPLNPQMGH
jgi:hypothetical protein